MYAMCQLRNKTIVTSTATGDKQVTSLNGYNYYFISSRGTKHVIYQLRLVISMSQVCYEIQAIEIYKGFVLCFTVYQSVGYFF